MNGRFFLDTNIFVYSFDRTAQAKARKAVQLLQQALATQKGVVSYQVVQEFFHVALTRFPKPLAPVEAEQYLNDVFRPLLAVHSSLALFADAFSIPAGKKLSWYDSLIVAAAIQARCDVLYTEDLQHGQRFGNLQVVNPFL
jgi:predicted nucleic acid-binding protein